MKTYARVFTAPADNWRDESSYHYIAEFSKPEFANEFIKLFRLNPKYKKYVIVVKEVQEHRKDSAEGKRVLVVSTMADYLEVDGKLID